MKVSKAIEILEKQRYSLPTDEMRVINDVLKLGIEALKRHRDKDYITYNGMHEPLPSETPEEDRKHE